MFEYQVVTVERTEGGDVSNQELYDSINQWARKGWRFLQVMPIRVGVLNLILERECQIFEEVESGIKLGNLIVEARNGN